MNYIKIIVFILIIISFIPFIAKFSIYQNKYLNSEYSQLNKINILKLFLDTGLYGEFLCFIELEKIKGNKKLLINTYLIYNNDKENTTEIDLMMIHEKGIFVIESKNYSGWIFGNERYKYWTQSLLNKKKEKFFNPIWQNKKHIAALLENCIHINEKNIYSIITFSERCELKKLTYTTPNTIIIKRNNLKTAIEQIIKENNIIYTETDIENICNIIKYKEIKDKKIKEQHIKRIKEKQV